MNCYSQWIYNAGQTVRHRVPDPNIFIYANRVIGTRIETRVLNENERVIHVANPPSTASPEKQMIYNNINSIGVLLTRLYPNSIFNVDAKGTLNGLRYRILPRWFRIDIDQLRPELRTIGFDIEKNYNEVLHLYQINGENRQ